MKDRPHQGLTESAAGIAERLETIFDSSQQRRVMNDQKSGDGWRRTLILDDRYVWKEFEFTADASDDGPWRIEHDVLQQLKLAGIHGPASIGFVIQRDSGKCCIRYCRECLDGEEIQEFTREDMPALGHFFADLHLAGIVTNDPFVYNFIRDPEGQPVFVDYGKASLFRSKNLHFYWKRAREETKFYRGAISHDRYMLRELLRHYRNRYQPSFLVKAFTTSLHKLQLARRYLRELRRRRARKG